MKPKKKKLALIKKLLIRIGWVRQFGLKYFFVSPKRIKNRRATLRARKVYGGSWASNRNQRRDALIKRYGSRCRYCKTPLKLNEMTLDHIVEATNGGTNHLDNLQILCLSCHILKNKLTGKPVNKPFAQLKTILDAQKETEAKTAA